MAEPLDRPAVGTGQPEGLPAAPGGQVLAPDRGADEPVYRPLSLLALAGFLVAVLFTLIIAIGGLTAFLKGTPLLGTPIVALSWLLPLAGGLLSAVAWFRIQRSEGTRAGTALAVWGIRLCVLLGLGYWAYYAATRFAVCNQAEKFTTEWFATLSKGEPESVRAAFLGTQTPDKRQRDDPKQPDQIEARYNVSEGSSPGRLTMFNRSEVVRLLRQAGPDAKIEKMGVVDWDYNQGGYWVTQTYRITTPDGAFEMPVRVHGSESRHKEFEGRQWYVQWDGTGRPLGMLSSEGQAHAMLRDDARRFANGWIARLRDDPHRAFLDTLEPAEATRLGNQPRRTTLLLAAAALGLPDPCAVCLFDPVLIDHLQPPAYRDFLAGGGVHSGAFGSAEGSWLDGLFKWAGVTAEVKRRLKPPLRPLEIDISVDNAVPIIVRNGDRIQLAHDVQMRLLPETVVEGRLVVETDARADESGKAPYWRIAGVEIDRVRTIARPAGLPGAGPR